MSFYQTNNNNNSPQNSSGAATPTTSNSAGSSTFIGSSIYSAFGGLMRRLSSDPGGSMSSSPHGSSGEGQHPYYYGGGADHDGNSSHHSYPHPHHGNGLNGAVYTPNKHRNHRRVPSPLQPPPLEPLVLHGFRSDTPRSARLMNTAVAEEIRTLVPERLRIEEDWKLVYSLNQDGASLGTLYEKCAAFRGRRGGFVLAVRDDDGGTFGAYLSEAPHHSPHYFGNGECFLWRASLMASLPPPPSADTTNLTGRSSTIIADPATTAVPPALMPIYDTDLETQSTATYTLHADDDGPVSQRRLAPGLTASPRPQQPAFPSLRFKAFPYSGVNEYYIYGEPHWLSVGAGDGKYGLWLDDSLEKGVSATCLTFGNEPLSDEGEKFGILGVEVWVIGAKD